MNAALLVHGGGGWKKSTLPGGDTTLVVEVGDVGVPSFSFSALALDPFVAFGLALFRGLFAPAAELDIFFKIKAVFFNTRKPAAPYFLSYAWHTPPAARGGAERVFGAAVVGV